MYKLFKETTTDWSNPTPNHIYLLSPDKQWLYGYVTIGTRDLRMLKGRIKFSPRYRTFSVVRSKEEI